MANVGFKYKPGTHWTQRPENKAKLSAMVTKIIKRGRKRGHPKKTKAEKIVARALKTKPEKVVLGATTIELNGWLLTLAHGSIKIEERK